VTFFGGSYGGDGVCRGVGEIDNDVRANCKLFGVGERHPGGQNLAD
jgi:hypothetical protein